MTEDTEVKVYTISYLSPQSPPDSEKRRFKNLKLFGKSVLTASLRFLLIVLIIAIIGVVPLTQLIVGSMHKNACPVQKLIPIYLIVSGVVGLVFIIILMLQVS